MSTRIVTKLLEVNEHVNKIAEAKFNISQSTATLQIKQKMWKQTRNLKLSHIMYL